MVAQINLTQPIRELSGYVRNHAILLQRWYFSVVYSKLSSFHDKAMVTETNGYFHLQVKSKPLTQKSHHKMAERL